MEEAPPPWVALPELDPWNPATHGLPEVYVTLTWLPYWTTLTLDEKADYLDRWNASQEWRYAIDLKYEWKGIDLEAEAREATKWREADVDDRPRRVRSLFDRLLRRR